jgi:glycosyltransferase involved in cell wall biosynthesis
MIRCTSRFVDALHNPLKEGRPLRVVHLLHTIAYGGIETVVINWLTAIDKTQVETQLVIFANPGETEAPFRKAAEAKGLQVNLIPWSRSKPIFKAACALRKLCLTGRADVLHTHNTYADIVGLIVGKSLNLKLISTIYVWSGPGFGLKRRLLQQIDAWVLKWFDKLTVQCEQARRDSKNWGFRPAEVELLPSGFRATPAILSKTERARLRWERGVSEKNLVVCNVSRFYPEKAHALMLHCWKKVIGQCPEARLWLYGVGPLEKKLLQLRKALDLEQTVSFRGFNSDITAELELCDIQLHPSYNEGIPLAICSGMAAGLPIVASNVGGIPEVIEHAKSGILVEAGDIEGFSEQLVVLIRDPRKRELLGKAARRFIKNEYSLEVAAQKLVEVYRSLFS